MKPPIPKEQLAGFCRRNHICKLALFGSILRDDFRPDSDIDVLVEFEPGHVPGFRFHPDAGRAFRSLRRPARGPRDA